jgi:hypothetical protein
MSVGMPASVSTQAAAPIKSCVGCTGLDGWGGRTHGLIARVLANNMPGKAVVMCNGRELTS